MAPELVDRDTEQLRILSIFQYVAAAVSLLAGLLPLIYALMGGVLALSPDSLSGAGEEAPPRDVAFLFLGFGILGTLLSWCAAAAHFFIARFLRRQQWYGFCVGASFFTLLTCATCSCSSAMVAIPSLIILLRPGMRAAFDREPPPDGPTSGAAPGATPEGRGESVGAPPPPEAPSIETTGTDDGSVASRVVRYPSKTGAWTALAFYLLFMNGTLALYSMASPRGLLGLAVLFQVAAIPLWWRLLEVECRPHRITFPMDMGYFVYATGALVVPYYLWRAQRWRGLWKGALLALISFLALALSALAAGRR